MYVIRFSSKFDVNRVNIQKLQYEKIMNPEAAAQKKPKFRFAAPKSLNDLFSVTYGAGTYYTNEMHRVVKMLHDKNMNIILFTDDDLVHDKTIKKFFNLGIKRKNSIAAFITDERSHKNMTDQFGKYKWMSILK